MLKKRLIPCLLLDGEGLVKTRRFKDPKYVGDPINAVKIFNDKMVDEIIFLDISASREGRGPNFDFLAEIASECFIPFAYGGGISTLRDAEKLFKLGVEKVSVNKSALDNPELVEDLSRRFGAQSVVVSIDIRKSMFGGFKVVANNGQTKTGINPVEFALKMQQLGAGELFINFVDRDGMQNGFETAQIKAIVEAVRIPVIACGGAGSLEDVANLAKDVKKISGISAGSLFVFKGPHRAVLINYPDYQGLQEIIGE